MGLLFSRTSPVFFPEAFSVMTSLFYSGREHRKPLLDSGAGRPDGPPCGNAVVRKVSNLDYRLDFSGGHIECSGNHILERGHHQFPERG